MVRHATVPLNPHFAALMLLGIVTVMPSNLPPAGGVVAQDQPASLAVASHVTRLWTCIPHADPPEPERSVQAALEGMKVENAAKIAFMTPFTADHPPLTTPRSS